MDKSCKNCVYNLGGYCRQGECRNLSYWEAGGGVWKDPILEDLPLKECKSETLTYKRINLFEDKEQSDGSTASYYELPEGASELQDLIAYRDMNAQLGEIFRACYRYGLVEHSPKIRDIKKIIFYAQKELERLEKYES